MSTKNLKIAGLLVIAAILLAASGCSLSAQGVRVGPLRTESRTVELGSAKSVSVEINMGAGELEVSGGADELLEADFTYNVAELKPEVSYSGGKLIVQLPDVKVGIRSLWDLDDYRYEWDLRLNDDVPMEMNVDLGAGTVDLALGSLSLTKLSIDMGAGRVTADLTGDWQNDLDAQLQGGVGELTVRLPRDVGVRVEIDGGLGEVNAAGLAKNGDVYTNDAYGESEVTLRIDINAGVGRINLEQ